MVRSLDVFNGENATITFVTDLETVRIPGNSSTLVKMSDEAWYSGLFHVDEEGPWYIKPGKSIATGLAIYRAG